MTERIYLSPPNGVEYGGGYIVAALRSGAVRGGWRADVQGLRAVAVLAVMAFHAGLPIPAGFLGVDVFFAISGFVITASLLREWRTSGHIALPAFYFRRFKRLVPALALVIAVTLVLSALLQAPFGAQDVTAATAAGAIAIIANFVIVHTTGGYFDIAAESNPLLHTWSLSVEEQYYLFFPAVVLLALLAARASRRPWCLAQILVLVGSLVSLALAVAYPLAGGSPVSGFYNPILRLWEFGAGALLALVPYWRLPAAAASALGLVGLSAVIASFFVFSSGSQLPGVGTLVPVLGTVAVIASGAGRQGLASRALAWRPMTKIGDLSYSLYLWHWPMIVFARVLWPENEWATFLAAMVSVGPAAMSHLLVERRVLTAKFNKFGRKALLVLATSVTTLALAGLLALSSANGFWLPSVQQAQAAAIPYHLGQTLGCAQGSLASPEVREGCTWMGDSNGRPIYLIGDSHADQFTEPVVAAAEKLGRPLLVSTFNGCPFIDLRVSNLDAGTEWNKLCETNVAETFRQLEAEEPGTVILANSDLYWTSSIYQVARRGGAAASGSEEGLSLFGEGMESTLSRLTAVGHEVVVVQSVPQFGAVAGWGPQNCPVLVIVAGDCGSTASLEKLTATQGPARDALVAATVIPGARVLDLWPFLCSPDSCSTSLGALVMYRDGSHLSVEGSRTLTSLFLRELS